MYTVAARGRPGPKPGKEFLEGNYAPIAEELFTEDLVVEAGALPEQLEGIYLRYVRVEVEDGEGGKGLGFWAEGRVCMCH